MGVVTRMGVACVLATIGLAAQATGVLHVTVTLTDADGTITPIPRVVLLVSDNPATGEPRRIRTGPDGAVTVTLPPGNYTVESDRPVMLGAQAYVWTEMIDVVAGRDITLALTPKNAEIENVTAASAGAASPMRADGAAIFNKWRDSVVEIWTPTAHASGFLVHENGLIATDYRSIGEAAAVEVEFSGRGASERVKIPGRVVIADRAQGVSLVWIDPKAVPGARPMPPACSGAPATAVEFGDRVVAIAAAMLEPKAAIPGTVGRVESSSFEVDWRLDRASGGPVFAADGSVAGLTIADPESDRSRRERAASRVIPAGNICPVLAAAEQKIAGTTPPTATRLPVEPAREAAAMRALPDPKAPRRQAPTISAASFDIVLLTPAMARAEPSTTSPRSDFGNWTDYVAGAPPVLLVRVTPQFEESLWKTIARGAAQTQGIPLPPMPSFNANFLRLSAYCDTAEVAPIHPFIIERRISESAAIREGLYVFGLTDFSRCGAVRFDLYSEKSGTKADSKSIDPKLLDTIGRPLP